MILHAPLPEGTTRLLQLPAPPHVGMAFPWGLPAMVLGRWTQADGGWGAWGTQGLCVQRCNNRISSSHGLSVSVNLHHAGLPSPWPRRWDGWAPKLLVSLHKRGRVSMCGCRAVHIHTSSRNAFQGAAAAGPLLVLRGDVPNKCKALGTTR